MSNDVISACPSQTRLCSTSLSKACLCSLHRHQHAAALGPVLLSRLFLKHIGSALLRPQLANALHQRRHWWTLLWHLVRMTG